ncbi:hypothetical protein EPO05_06175 [Patescibacteria group bacterium]|nr:MAG: hypothetical protein EPO05_06175 [Patescibacteria group bacterium]
MISPEYIVGLTDGEGSFCMHLSQNATRRNKAEFRFFLKLIEDDKPILDELKRYFGCGNVYFQKDNRPNHHHCYRYEVSNRNELWNIIVPFFKKHCLQLVTKKRDFDLFSKALAIVMESEEYSDRMTELVSIRDLMHRSSPGAGNPLAVVGT